MAEQQHAPAGAGIDVRTSEAPLGPAGTGPDRETLRAADPAGADARIDAAIAEARRVLASCRRRRLLLGGLAATGGLTALVGLGFVAAGHAVPALVYGGGLAVLVLAAAAAAVLARVSARTAARIVDERFELEDGVSSALGFRTRPGAVGGGAGGGTGMLARQRAWVAEHLAGLDLGLLRTAPGRGLVAAAVVLPLLAIGLSVKGDAPHVLAERESRARTVALAEELNEGLREELERQREEIADEDELEAMDPEGLLEMVEELAVTPDEAELLRQYAEMEREVTRRAAELDRARAEELLAAAGAELSESRGGRRLGNALERTDFEAAAEQLEAMKPSAAPPSAAELAAKRAELEALKEAASTLGEAARRFRGQRDAARDGASEAASGARDGRRSDRSSDRSANGRPSGGEPSDADPDAAMSDSIASDMQELAEAAEAMEQALGQCEGGACSASDLRRLQQASQRVAGAMSRLQQRMRQLDAQRSARARLSSLARTLGQCQGAVAGQCSSPFAGQGPGIGAGSAGGENETVTRDDGILEQLRGIRNADGPSQTIVQDADSGTGTSGRGAVSREVEYARQLERFVSRPDVPESVRGGVKTYFETIHGTASEAPAGEAGGAGTAHTAGDAGAADPAPDPAGTSGPSAGGGRDSETP